MRLQITNLIIAVALLSQPICAQDSNLSLGWDLTYSFVLERNNIGSREWIRQWLASGYQAPAGKWISEWRGEPIVSSILIEWPAFHAGEHTTMWFVRTKNHAYYWQSVEGQESTNEKKVLQPRVYDGQLLLARYEGRLDQELKVNWPYDVVSSEFVRFPSYLNTLMNRLPEDVKLDMELEA